MSDAKVNMIFTAEDHATSVMNKLEENAKKTNKELEKTNKGLKASGSEMSGLFKNVDIGAIAVGVSKFATAVVQAGKKIVELSKVTADYVESLNLLDVAFDGNTESIRKFTSSYSEILNLDEATLINSASHFKMLGQSMGLAADEGERFSKVLTQMNLDVSSLYNLSFKDAQNALQNATMGRGTALKQKTGVSVLESTVQTTLTTLGVDAYVKDMNDTEKAIARVISMIYQLRTSQGDLARTIEAPANQFRVFGEQMTQLARNIGSVFLPAIAAILPYLNAILIVINKIISAIASFVGFSENMWDFFGESDSLVDAFDDIGASIGGVGDAAAGTAKKLQGLRAFDKLNNLTTPTSGGGGGGAGGGGTGIDPKLLDLFKKLTGEYNSMLDGLETKATRIAKAIMKELGTFDTSNAVIAFRNLEEAMKPIGKFAFDNLKNLYTEFLKPLAQWTISDVLPTFLNTLAKAYKSVDWDRLTESLKDFYGVLARFTKALIDPLLYIYSEFLVPFGSYVFNNSIYGVIDGLTGLLNILITYRDIQFDKLKSVIDFLKEMDETASNLEPVLSKFTPVLSAFFTELQPIIALKNLDINGLGKGIKLLGDAFTYLYDSSKQKQKGYSKETEENLNQVKGVLDSFSKDIEKINLFPTAANLPDSLYEDFIDLKNRTLADLDTFVGEVNKKTNAAKEEEIKNINDLFKNHYLSEDEKNEALAKVDNYYGEIQSNTSNAQNRIKQIYENAAKEHRSLTIDEKNEIQSIQSDLQKNLVSSITQSSVEQEAILRELSNNKKELSIETASEMIKSALKTKDEEIKAAKDKYIGTLTEAKRLKEMGIISEEQYNKMVQEAEQDRDNEIKAAEDKYDEIYSALEENHEDIANYIDKDSGGVKSSWDAFWTGIGKKVDDIWDNHISKYFTKEFWQKEWEKIKTAFGIGVGIVKETLNKKWEEIKMWFRLNVGKYFTREYWQGLFTSAFSNIHIKTPHITWTTGGSATGIVKKILETLNLPTSLPKLKVNWYAQGGLPDVGQLFIANERGPELVGQIGGQSFVANQNQMMDLLDKKLSSANGLQNATFVIQVGSKEVAKEVLTDLQSMAKSNGKPITINAG